MAVSYIIMLQATKTWTKNLYPEESKGQYESFWAVSYTFIPVFLGSNIGDYIVRNEGLMQINEMTHRYEYIPNGKIFLVGVIISVFSITYFRHFFLCHEFSKHSPYVDSL